MTGINDLVVASTAASLAPSEWLRMAARQDGSGLAAVAYVADPTVRRSAGRRFVNGRVVLKALSE